MPFLSATLASARAARTRVRDARVAPLDITAPASAYHAQQLRIALRRWLHTTGVEALLADDLAWAGYEALADVVEHAYTPDHLHPVMRLQAQVCPPLLRITITDYGRWRLPAQQAGYRGRGLSAMRVVTSRTHVIRSADGTMVVLFAGLGGRAAGSRHP